VQDYLDDLKVLSIGVGENNNYVPVTDANWGYWKWVLDPTRPLLAVNALLRGNTTAVDFQCRNLLPHGSYYRLNPYYSRNVPIPFMINTAEIRKTVQSEQTQAMVAKTIDWLDRSGWMELDEDEAGTAPATVATPSVPETAGPQTPTA
jgi:hypothetical protein